MFDWLLKTKHKRDHDFGPWSKQGDLVRELYNKDKLIQGYIQKRTCKDLECQFVEIDVESYI